MVGRSHSVTHDVQASVRMNPDMINEGYAAGYTAGQVVKTNTTLHRVDLGPVQDHLVEIGNISQEDRLKRCVETPEPTDHELVLAAEDPDKKVNLATLLRASDRSIPYLKASFASEPTLAKAKALCALGDKTVVEYLASWLDNQPLGEGLAYQWDNFLSTSDVDNVVWASWSAARRTRRYLTRQEATGMRYKRDQLQPHPRGHESTRSHRQPHRGPRARRVSRTRGRQGACRCQWGSRFIESRLFCPLLHRTSSRGRASSVREITTVWDEIS